MASDKKARRLQELRGSNFELTKGEPDIRGWDVIDTNGHRIGKVQELIFDARAFKVRYLVLNVIDSKELQLEKRTVLVPIGLAELDKRDDHVILHTVTPFQLRALPRYDKDTLGPRAERDISTVFGRNYTSAGAHSANVEEDMDERFYEHDHFNNDLNRSRRGSSNAAGSGHEQQTQSKHHREMSEAEAASLRREAELGTPLANSDPAEAERLKENREEQRRGETDEEYVRRARKNLDNR